VSGPFWLFAVAPLMHCNTYPGDEKFVFLCMRASTFARCIPIYDDRAKLATTLLIFFLAQNIVVSAHTLKLFIAK
jgi:hypothetical protein